MNGPAVSPCQYARDRHRDFARWRNLWTILLFVFGTTVIVFLCLAILLFIREEWLPGALTVLGTIVNGAAVKWVYDRRMEAVKEEAEAYKDVLEQCKPPTTLEKAATTSPPVDDPEAQFAKLKLFGMIR